MTHTTTLARARGLDGTTLKLIALGLMLLDHIHYFFAFTGAVPGWFSMLGRLAAPLFLFCAVEGFVHTHSRPRYWLRLWAIAAPMGLLRFFMQYGGLFVRADGFYPQNGFLSNLVLLVPIWQGIDWLRQRRFARGAAAIVLPLAWPFVLIGLYGLARGDGGGWLLETVVAAVGYSILPCWNFIADGGLTYIIGGVLLYLFRRVRGAQLGVWAVWTFATEFVSVFLALRGSAGFALSQMFTTYYEWFSVAAVALMALYNGRRGAGCKRLFYWFYPAHIYILYAASFILCA